MAREDQGEPAVGRGGAGPQADTRPIVRAHKARWRRACRERSRCAARPGLRVGIAATVTAEPLVPLLGTELLERGIAPEIALAPYNQLFQTCLDWRGAFPDEGGLDALVLLWRLDEIVAEALRRYAGGAEAALGDAHARIDALADAVAALRDAFAGALFAATPPLPQLPDVDPRDPHTGPRLLRAHAALSARWLERLAGIAGATPFALDSIERCVGSLRAFDARTAYLYRQPWRETFWLEVARDLARALATARVAPHKCLVLDCDDTLWGGIVGEVGLGGIALGDDFPGSVYLDFQRQILALHDRGVLLALASKNDEASVWEVFERHDAMLLRRDHLAAWRIDWSSKANNVAAIAAELNLGRDSLVFVDDNPSEIAEVSALHPEVTCLRVPEEPAELPRLLPEAALFDGLGTTTEDRTRTQMVRAEASRRRERAAMTEEQFLASLELEVEVRQAAPEHLARVAQLIAKTNQFNLTSIRRSPEEVEALAKADDARILIARVADRFGDYGLVGVAVLRAGHAAWSLDTFLLSCRVLGRGVETAFLALAAEHLRREGAQRLRAHYVETPKNGPVAQLLPDHGFAPDGDAWLVDLTRLPAVPAHIRIR